MWINISSTGGTDHSCPKNWLHSENMMGMRTWQSEWVPMYANVQKRPVLFVTALSMEEKRPGNSVCVNYCTEWMIVLTILTVSLTLTVILWKAVLDILYTSKTDPQTNKNKMEKKKLAVKQKQTYTKLWLDRSEEKFFSIAKIFSVADQQVWFWSERITFKSQTSSIQVMSNHIIQIPEEKILL